MQKNNQIGGGALPYRWFNADATPFKPCESMAKMAPPLQSIKQEGGGALPYNWFNPDCKEPFKPCGCGKQQSGIKAPAMQEMGQDGFVGYEHPVYGAPVEPNNDKVEQVRANQVGGFPTGAPFEVFSEGTEKLKYNYDMAANFGGIPTFQKLPANRFANKFF